MASMPRQQDGQAAAPSTSKFQQELMNSAGILLLLAGSHWVLPAGHPLLLRPSIITGIMVVQACSLAFSLATAHVLDAPTCQKLAGGEEQSVAQLHAVSTTKRPGLQDLTMREAIGGLLAVVAMMKVLGALGLLDSPARGLALAFLLGAAAKSALEKGRAGRNHAERHEESCACGLCPSGHNAPVDDAGCPYSRFFWEELDPDALLDRHVQDLSDDVCSGAEQED